MLEHLKQLEAFMRPHAPEHIRTPAALLVEYGRSFELCANTFKGPRGMPKLCYMNAGKAALRDPNMLYVEGKIAVHGVPIEHAWNFNRVTGELIDPTLSIITSRDAESRPERYFGIVFKAAYLRRTVLRKKTWGLICYDNPHLFQRSTDVNAFIEETQLL